MLSKSEKRGRLIVFEGMEGVGKSTLAGLTRDWLEKRYGAERPVVQSREPGSRLHSLCEDLREMVFRKPYSPDLDRVQQGLMLFIDHYTHAREVSEIVNAGGIVISDRWLYSQYAYDAVKRESQQEAIALFRQFEPQQITPDCVIILQTDPDLALRRAMERQDKAESQSNKQWGKRPDLNRILRDQYDRMVRNNEIDAGVVLEVVYQDGESAEDVFQRVAAGLTHTQGL